MKAPKDPATLDAQLDALRLPFIREHCQTLAAEAGRESHTHIDYLSTLIEGESAAI